jgi:predicted porin
MKKLPAKHTLTALALAAAAQGATAQSNIQVYGIVDAALARVTNADAAGNAATKMPSLTGTVPSRIGFRGTEDLGNGLQAFFVLENGFGPDTGVAGQGGRLFGRAAQVGLKGKWGTLTLGRQNTMTFIGMAKADIMGPHLFSISSIDLYIPNARSDNAIGYLGQFNGLVVGATWSLGRDASSAGGPAATNCGGEVASDDKACRQVTGMLGYETPRWGANVTYDRMYGNTGAAGGLTSSANTDTRTNVGGYAMVGAVRIGAGVMHRKTAAATGLVESDLAYLGASYPFGAFTLDGQIARRDTKRSANDVTLAVARLSYALSKRTAVYTSAGHISNDGVSAVALDVGGTVGAGMSQNGVMAGIRHSF